MFFTSVGIRPPLIPLRTYTSLFWKTPLQHKSATLSEHLSGIKKKLPLQISSTFLSHLMGCSSTCADIIRRHNKASFVPVALSPQVDWPFALKSVDLIVRIGTVYERLKVHASANNRSTRSEMRPYCRWQSPGGKLVQTLPGRVTQNPSYWERWIYVSGNDAPKMKVKIKNKWSFLLGDRRNVIMAAAVIIILSH